VVVLIIGILAAVALPQYQKAVLKSRYSNIQTLTHSLVNAQEMYYMANGTYSVDFSELDISMPEGKLDGSSAIEYKYAWGSCFISSKANIGCTSKSAKMSYQVWYQNSTDSSNKGIRICVAKNEDVNSAQNKLCKSETGAATSNLDGTDRVWIYPRGS
jgi:type IV pilus assembly protein PilE